MKIIHKNPYPRIGLFSVKCRPILAGEEITYSYSDYSKDMPWRDPEPIPSKFKYIPQTEDVVVENPEKFCIFCYKKTFKNIGKNYF